MESRRKTRGSTGTKERRSFHYPVTFAARIKIPCHYLLHRSWLKTRRPSCRNHQGPNRTLMRTGTFCPRSVRRSSFGGRFPERDLKCEDHSTLIPVMPERDRSSTSPRWFATQAEWWIWCFSGEFRVENFLRQTSKQNYTHKTYQETAWRNTEMHATHNNESYNFHQTLAVFSGEDVQPC